jgi:threonine/homoserine/homoserine lactone efflux protein
MTLEAWLIFCATETVLCLTPGPAVLFVLSTALARGARPGVSASVGILAANAGYFALSGTSLGALLLASYELFFLVKWVGAAYLVWVGLRMLVVHAPAVAEAADATPARGRRAFAGGLITQGANPKALVFFTALLPQFIDPGAPVGAQVAILGVSSFLIELAVLAGYVAVAQRARRLAHRPRVALGLQRAGGLLLLGAGAGLAAIRRGS